MNCTYIVTESAYMIPSENSTMTQPNLHGIEINYDLSQIGIEMKMVVVVQAKDLSCSCLSIHHQLYMSGEKVRT